MNDQKESFNEGLLLSEYVSKINVLTLHFFSTLTAELPRARICEDGQ